MGKSILDKIEQVNIEIEEMLDALPYVNATDIGLDLRAGRVYVDVEHGIIIAAQSGIQSLEYYGGFEYIGSAHTTVFDDIKIYHDSNSRVEQALEHYTNREIES